MKEKELFFRAIIDAMIVASGGKVTISREDLERYKSMELPKEITDEGDFIIFELQVAKESEQE